MLKNISKQVVINDKTKGKKKIINLKQDLNYRGNMEFRFKLELFSLFLQNVLKVILNNSGQK